jgi:hypothetical protein
MKLSSTKTSINKTFQNWKKSTWKNKVKYSNTVYDSLVSLQISPICQRPDYTCDFLLNVLTEAYSTAHPIDCCAFAGDLCILFFGKKNA